jgi:hypothetical protein
MIKNLIYSLFLHLSLISIIYFSFNFPKFYKNHSKNISVSLVSVYNKSEIENNFSKENIENKPIETITESKKKNKKLSKTKREIVKKEPEQKKNLKPETKIDNLSNDNKKNETLNQRLEDYEEKQKGISLSAREKFNIQSQLKKCYHLAIEQSKTKEDDKIKIIIMINIDENGIIHSDLDRMIDQKKYQENQKYRKIIDNVKNALDLCSPLRNLPKNKIDKLKNITLEFGNDLD